MAGTWKDLTDNVNSMASNLTGQVRNIADVTTAVARGDLTKKITVDVKGEILQLKITVNTMVDQLNAFASEVTRVAREVGTDGKLGGQAVVPGVGGTWKDLTDNVNSMAGNLTAQVRNIAYVTTAVATGDLGRKITVDVKGEILQLKDTINTMVDQLSAFASEVTRVAREVGTEGKLGGQAQVRGVAGTWKDLTDSVNFMAGNLTAQVRNIADVTTAVARGDLTKKITVDVKGEILQVKNTVNTMVDQLNAFASEVTRVAREVGTDGKLGGQAQVRGVAGTWKDLTDNVNSMASNLTNQVRGIAKVVTAVANGDLSRKLALEARGEIAELADTINGMTDTLATFAEQVTSVAREVGVEGKLGGQAKVPGAAGTWRALTDNVNQLAGNLTTQVRAIGNVATAVTKGDLTRMITVEASGEVAALKDNINEMIRNLRDTTRKTTEQDWLKTNLARFTRMLQGQRDLVSVAQQILSELAPLVSAQHGAFFIAETDASKGETGLKMLASYAERERKPGPTRFQLAEGLVGQCAYEKQRILVTDVPPDYIRISSGLGEAAPRSLIVMPVIFEGQVNAVLELASFIQLSDIHQSFLDQLTESVGIVVNTIAASTRTETLLKQSQSLTQELRSQQEELQRTNDQLQEKAKLLELKNTEVELAKREIEEKAQQLALTSQYKSEFLANMSHELRTPLNSLLILSSLLSENPDGNLSPKQVEFARTIHASGTDLLELINDILDLSKIESGTVEVELAEVAFTDLRDYVEQSFRHVAQVKGLAFGVELATGLPDGLFTDVKRLQQVLRNLLSNAFKFTERGGITLEIKQASYGWSRSHDVLSRAPEIIALAVNDTGIGIPADKQRIIFEAFQQADGTTSRKYGGTGLGLSISRELARLLGGEIGVVSEPGRGSAFTLYLPREYVPGPSGRTPSRSRITPRGMPRLLPPVSPASALAERDGDRVVDHDRERDRDDAVPETLVAEISAGDALTDDRGLIQPGDRVVLVIEDDVDLARGLLQTARQLGTRGVLASRAELGLGLAAKLTPALIVLDVDLRQIDGWTVLDRLEHDRATRHLSVLVLAREDVRLRALRMGALGFVQKNGSPEAPGHAIAGALERAQRRVKRLLVLDDERTRRTTLIHAIAGVDVEVVASACNAAELDAVAGAAAGCDGIALRWPIGWDTGLLAEKLLALGLGELPMVVLAAEGTLEASAEELSQLAQTRRLTVAHSVARLLEESMLTLHRSEASLGAGQRRMLDQLDDGAPGLAGASVLVIDDDVRNIFAVTSALERHGASVVFAENGRDGLLRLEQTPGVELVLVDIMMPEMDGYEVMRRIRAREQFRNLPVIAVTAKAMREDREKSIRAGASDYIAKPVDLRQLVSLARVWLARARGGST